MSNIVLVQEEAYTAARLLFFRTKMARKIKTAKRIDH